METIKIGSFNTKDNAINRNGGMRPDGISNAQILSKEILENGFDLLGTQELTINYVNELKKFLPEYSFYGNYRYGKGILTKIPYNENNNIITNKKVVFEKTFWLPWIPNNIKDVATSIQKMSIMPRIATVVIIEENDKEYCMINTHLDYQIESLQVRQLEALKNLILKYKQKYPVIVTGDFNMEVKEGHFDNFISDLNESGIQRVEINENTWHGKDGSGKTLDHIFIPKSWKIEDAGIVKVSEEEKTSDHDAIFVEAKTR